MPDFKELSSPKSDKIHDFTRYDEKINKYITRERVHTRDIFRRLNYTQIFHEFCDKLGHCERRICEYTIRYLFPEEIELLSRLISLTIVNKYGGFNFEKFDRTHRNVVYEIRKE